MKTGTRPEIAVTTPNAKLRIGVEEVIADYRLAVRSRAASELSRRDGHARRARTLEGSAGERTVGLRSLSRGLPDAARDRPRVGLQALSRLTGRPHRLAGLFPQRRGGVFRDDRQRWDDRGRVLGK